MAMTGGTSVLLKTGYPNYGTETNFPLRLYLYYRVVSQDKVNAITTLSLGMYFVCPDKWYVGAWSDYGSYLGTTSNTFSKSVPTNFTGTLWLAENITFKVQHDAQGKGTAKIAWKWGVDSSYGQFVSPSGTYSVTLSDIPRASAVSVGGAVNAGSALAITVSRKVSSFTHTLRYMFGNDSGSIATGVGVSHSWNVSLDILKQIPSARQGTGTIYCDTYSGSSLIGTTSCAFTVVAPDNENTKPSASMLISPSGSVPEDFSGTYILGKTAVKADFTADPKYKATIKSYALSVNGKTTNGDPATSAILSESGTLQVTGTVTDSRGISRTLTDSIIVHPYDIPGVAPGASYTAVICERSKEDGTPDQSGTHLRIIAKRRYSTVDGKNRCTLRYRYKAALSANYGSWNTLIDAGAVEDEYSGVLADVVTSTSTSYDVEIGVVDTMGSKNSVVFRVPTDGVAFHIREGGKGAAFFGYSEKDGELTVNGDLHVAGNFSADNITDFVVEHGSSGDWNYRKWNSGIAEVWGKAAGAIQGAGVTNNIYHGYVSVEIPAVFNSVPKSLTYSVYATSGYDWCGKAVLTSATRFNAYLLSQSNLENLNATVYAHAIGTWK